jgi:LPS O-antigen subunit length determinant protein (WzzB/FepE family)
MKKNNFYLSDNEIDLSDLIKLMWRDKIIVLSISIICGFFGYVYSVSQPKMYKAEIVLRNAPSSLFEAYRTFLIVEPLQSQSQSQSQLQLQSSEGISKHFNDEFKTLLLSLDNLVQFVENNNKIDDLKNNLKEKDISASNYFNGKFEYVEDKNKKILNKYSLIYSEPFPVDTFLKDYIIFTQQQALIIFKKTLTQKIIAEISLYQQHLKIAENIGLKNPILQSMIEGRGVINEPEALFYKGTKVLSQQLIFLNDLLDETQNLKLDYNPILEKTLSKPFIITQTPKMSVSIGLILGLFFSFIIIFLKKYLNHKVY